MGHERALRPQTKISETRALVQVQALVDRIRRSATRLPDAPGQREERLRKSEADFWFFARTYFPHHFAKPSAACHYELVEVLSEPGVSVARLPRYWAKTTISQFAALWQLLFGKRQFAVIIGKSSDTAAESVLTLILELEENERILQDFGDQRSDQWNMEKGFRLRRHGNWLMPLGRGEPILGRKKGAARPDLIIADDIEDEELVRNPVRVKRLLKWWLQSVLPAMAAGGTAIWLNTVLSVKSASSLLLDPEWSYGDAEEPPQCRRLSWSAMNPEGESTWPEQWPVERLQAKKAEIGSTAFNLNFLHLAEDEGGLFRGDWFRFYEQLPAGCVTVLAVDPSARSKESNDNKAIIALAKDLKTGNYHCRHAWIRTATISAMCHKICDLFQLLQPAAVLFETNGFQELVKDELIRIARTRGLRLPIVCIEHRINKEVRIQTLQPVAENGQLHFMRRHSDQEILMEQLCYFPSSAVKDDGPDALEMAHAYLRKFRLRDDARPRYERIERRTNMAEVL